MGVETERYDPDHFIPPWIKNEHLKRFSFASQFVRDKVVVDCACGSGVGTHIFAEAGARHVHAFDISDDAITAAKERGSGSPNVSVEKADALKLPLPDATADLYVSFETIEHLTDDQAFLHEIKRVLKPDGLFICSTPDRRVYSPGRTIASKPWNQFHVREYDTEEFRARLKSFFSTCELYGQNPTPKWRASTMEFIGRSSPGHTAVRINQVLKLPRFLLERPEWRSVVAADPDYAYEVNVAVCRR